MVSLFFVIVTAVIIIGLGVSVISWLDRDHNLPEGERLGFAFLVGCIPVSFSISLIGHWRLDGVSMAAVAGASLLLALPGLRALPWRGYVAALSEEATAAASDRWLALLWVGAVFIATSSLIQGLAPPNDYDSLMYHLAVPRYDVELGHMGIPWDRQLPHVLFPGFSANLSRLALVLADDGAAQMTHGLFGVVAALGSAMLVRRLGYGRHIALLASVLFFATRAVIWQMATVETDVTIAAYGIFAVLAYLAWQEGGSYSKGILFGLVIGAGILVKLHGFVIAVSFAPLIIFHIIKDLRGPKRWVGTLWIGPLTALTIITPHLIKMTILTGNPLFPLFNLLFNPGKPNFFGGLGSLNGTGNGIVDLLTAPWNFSVLPMHYFDGMILGAPYLLVLCPLLLLDTGRRRWLPVLSMAFVFYVIWFYMLSQQVRFLIQIAPMMTAVAAVGGAALWGRTKGLFLFRAPLVLVFAILAINQLMFVGAYAVIRLPAAFGLISDADFHEKTPNMGGAHFKTCTYIDENLKPGDRYFANFNWIFYYCPQVPAIANNLPGDNKWWLELKAPRAVSRQEFAAAMTVANPRYFLIARSYEKRRNLTGKTEIQKLKTSDTRFGPYLVPVLEELRPVSEGPYTAVYDGKEVIKLLRQQIN
jgi:hypothetical protein